jgi:soluble lytic murein transglycosylase-like protein
VKRIWLVLCLVPILLYADPYPVTKVPHNYYGIFLQYCDTYKVPSYYMARLIQWESGWDDQCIHVNPDGSIDYGLGALNSKALSDLARWHNGEMKINVMDGIENLRVSVQHVRWLYDRTGSWWSSVTAYNMGYQGWLDWCAGKRPLPPGTKKELDYVFQ